MSNFGYYCPATRYFYSIDPIEYHSATDDCWELGWSVPVYYNRERNYSLSIHGTAESGSAEYAYTRKQTFRNNNLVERKYTVSGRVEVWREGRGYKSSYYEIRTDEYRYRDGTVKCNTKSSSNKSMWTQSLTLTGQQRADYPAAYLYIPTALRYDARDAMSQAIYDGAAWSSLVQSCITSAHAWDNNLLALAHDIITLRADVESMCSTVKTLTESTKILMSTGKGARAVTKSATSAYLGNKYGYGLTLEDCWSVGEAVSDIRSKARSLKYGVQKLRARYRSVKSTNLGEYQVEYAYMARIAKCDSALMDIIRTTMSWDLYPTTANMWDFVPYSFVVDWLVDIGGLLETIDTHLERTYLPVRSITKSVKISSLLTDPSRFWGKGASGIVSINYYRRFPAYDWDPLLPILRPGSGLNGHFLESAALIIQRITSAK